jgi:NAD(P)-dependent dehydrogenase (short-subunit alcohol dehydrogenase family)
MKLEAGQVAVVTGAASGIGFALSDAFAARGLDVVLADIEDGALQAATERVRAHGGRARGLRTDVTDLAQVQALADATLGEFGRVDVVCNNAGVDSDTAPAWEMDIRDWKWVLDVNLWGCIHGVHTFMPHLVAQGHGHMVNTASMGGIRPLPFLAPYAASKRAIVAITETLRIELDERAPDVGVTALCPSLVHTNIGTSARNRPQDLIPERGADQAGLRAHLGKMEQSALEPADVARLVLGAIETNRLRLMTHPESREAVEEWARALIADAALAGQ